MSDRSFARVTVYAVAPGTAGAVRKALLAEDFDIEFADVAPLTDSGLRLGQQYTNEELPLYGSVGVAHALHRLGATFEVSQDAHYNNYNGEVWRGTPVLGLYRSAGSDSGGSPLVTAASITEAIAATGDRTALLAALQRLTGDAWSEVFAVAAATFDVGPQGAPGQRTSLPLPVCDTCPAEDPPACGC